MPILSQEILSRLIDRIEALYIENLILRDELRHRNQDQLAQMIEQAKNSPRLTAKVRALFAPIRNALLDEVLLEQEIQEFLKAAPPKSNDVN